MIERPYRTPGKNVDQEKFDYKSFTKTDLPLRDDVLQEIAEYCANISQDLWIAYSSDLLPAILRLDWSEDLHLEFMQHRRLIDRIGINAAAEIVLLALHQLVQKQ